MTSALPGIRDTLSRALVSGYRNRWRDSNAETKRKNPRIMFHDRQWDGGLGIR